GAAGPRRLAAPRGGGVLPGPTVGYRPEAGPGRVRLRVHRHGHGDGTVADVVRRRPRVPRHRPRQPGHLHDLLPFDPCLRILAAQDVTHLPLVAQQAVAEGRTPVAKAGTPSRVPRDLPVVQLLTPRLPGRAGISPRNRRWTGRRSAGE